MDDGLTLVNRVETVHRGVHPLFGTLRCKPGAVRLELHIYMFQDQNGCSVEFLFQFLESVQMSCFLACVGFVCKQVLVLEFWLFCLRLILRLRHSLG